MGEPDKKPPVPSATADGSSKRNGRHNRKKRHGAKPAVQPEKFKVCKEELDGNYFDCTGYGQSDRFMKTVQKIADYIGQEYKSGGVTRTKVMTQTAVTIPLPTRPVSTSVAGADGSVTITPPDILDISDYQSAKKIVNYKIQNQTENHQEVFSLVWQ
jgi:hypothetical protein